MGLSINPTIVYKVVKELTNGEIVSAIVPSSVVLPERMFDEEKQQKFDYRVYYKIGEFVGPPAHSPDAFLFAFDNLKAAIAFRRKVKKNLYDSRGQLKIWKAEAYRVAFSVDYKIAQEIYDIYSFWHKNRDEPCNFQSILQPIPSSTVLCSLIKLVERIATT